MTRETEVNGAREVAPVDAAPAGAEAGPRAEGAHSAGRDAGARRGPSMGSLVGATLLLGLLVVAPLGVDEFWTFVFATALVYALAALSVNVLFGQAGMIGLFPAAFLGIGAYSAAIFALEGLPWLAAFAGAIVVSLLLGAVVGLAGTRLRGMTFGIVTFAFALAADTMVFRHGVFGIDPAFGAEFDRPEIGGIDLFEERNFYYFVLAVAIITWLVVRLHEGSRPGRAWRAIRDNELAALAIGVRVGLYRVWASALAGAVAGAGGVLFVALQGQVNVESFTPVQSLLIFTAAMTAGTRTIVGAVLAGALLIVLPELLKDQGVSSSVVPLIFAVGVLLSLKGADGIVGAVRHAAPQLGHLVGARRPGRSDPRASG